MNYYERHIGDYIKKTAHLSLLEHGIYTRLLDVYYDREQPLPDDKVARLIGARTEPETQALQVVLQEFFELRDGLWVNSRCDEEIATYVEGEPEREVKKANEDNRLKRHRQERSDLFKVLVSAGKHAPWNTGMQELRALVSALQVPGTETTPAMSPATATATPATATHTPVPIHQTPDTKEKTGDSGSAQAQTPPPAYLGDENEPEIPGKARVPIAAAWELPAAWGHDAEALGWKPEEILRESEKFRQYYVSGKGAGTRRGIKGWRQSWSNWLSNAEKFTPIRRIA